MAYIRSTSNPENLYIYRTVEKGNPIVISHRIKEPLASKLEEGETISVPYWLFRNACLCWSVGIEHFNCRDLIVRTQHIYTDTGDIIKEDGCSWLERTRPNESLAKFSYKNHFFYMWHVTWMYAVNNFIQQRRIDGK